MGTTSEKLTYLNTTKGKIKDSINLTGAGITTEPFRQYAVKLKDAYVDIINNGTETLYNNFPKVSATGESMELSNTYEAPMQIDLKGNTSQVQLSGKNLFNDYNTTSSTNRGVAYSFTNNEILINGTYDKTGNLNMWLTESNNGNASNNMALLNANTTYTISIYIVSGTINNTNNQLYISSRDTNKTNFAWNYKVATYDSSTQRYKVSFTTTDSIYISGIRYSITSNDTAVFNNLKLKIQIEQNNTSTDFEQYCGGIPSPNPSYPQDIHNVSGNNTINITNELKDSNNIIDAYLGTSQGIHTNAKNKTTYIAINDNTTYTITKTLGVRFRVCFTDVVPDGNDNPIFDYYNADGLNSYTMTNTNHKYLAVWYYNQDNDTATPQETFNNMSIYSSIQTYPINLPSGMELCKIGTYQDYFYKENDKWYLHKEIGKVVIDGSENWATSGAVVPSGVSAYSNGTNSGFISNTQGYSNLFTIIDNATEWNVPSGNGTARYTSNQLYIKILTSIASDVNALKTWLGNNNIIMYGILATPTNTEITDTTLIEQLDELESATSKNGTTNINQENNDLPFIITASALEKE